MVVFGQQNRERVSSFAPSNFGVEIRPERVVWVSFTTSVCLLRGDTI